VQITERTMQYTKRCMESITIHLFLFFAFAMPGERLKGGMVMQVNLMDVRLDKRRLPYVVHEVVGEYAGEKEVRIDNPEIAVHMLNEVFHMKDFAEERVYVILLSGSGKVISVAEISRGIIDCALVGIREIMQRVLLSNAARVILAHNHLGASEAPSPSSDDRVLTENLRRACKLMRIVFCDHIIIEGEQYFSFNREWKKTNVNRQEMKEEIRI